MILKHVHTLNPASSATRHRQITDYTFMQIAHPGAVTPPAAAAAAQVRQRPANREPPAYPYYASSLSSMCRCYCSANAAISLKRTTYVVRRARQKQCRCLSSVSKQGFSHHDTPCIGWHDNQPYKCAMAKKCTKQHGLHQTKAA